MPSNRMKKNLNVKKLINESEPLSTLKAKRIEQFKLANEGKLENYSENCCFCKVEMTDIYKTHNPYPLNKDKDASCCKDCCDTLVGPARLILLMKVD